MLCYYGREPTSQRPAIAKEKRNVELLYSDLSIDFCHCRICSSCKAFKELASAGWIVLGADVGVVGRSAGFGAARLLGIPAAGRIERSVFMSASVRRMLFVTVGIVISFAASAFDLNGAWTADESNCAKVFVTKNNKLTMTRNSGVYGGGFIVEGNQIRGQAKACKITSRKEEGGVLHLIASCTTDIAVLGMEEVSAKIESDNQITRIYPSFPEMGISFYRCKL